MGASAQARGHPTESTSTQSEFPQITQEQFATLERVVAAVPAGAQDWASFEATYEQLGVDENEYYPLCLKLSMERGLDWRAKWETVKASFDERGISFGGAGGRGGHARAKSAGGFDLLKAKVDQITTASPRRPPSAPAPASSAPRPSTYTSRPRVDSTHTTTPRPARPTRSFLVEAVNGHSSSDDLVGVPSPVPWSTRPRGEHSAPILPSPRQDASLIPAGSARREKHSSLPPTSSPSVKLNARFAEQSPRTSSAHPLLDSYLQSAPSPSSAPHSIALRTKSEIVADDFRRSSLLTGPWYTWRQKIALLRTRQENLDAARRVVLSRWVLARWREAMAREQELRRRLEIGRQVRREATLRAAFETWKSKVEDRRRGEWEAGLRSAWEVVRGRWKEKARRECFDVSLLPPRSSSIH